MAMISSFSYYGVVNEKGEKVVDFETTQQEENIITNQIAEETQENVVNEVGNTIAQAEIKQEEQTNAENVVDQNQTPTVEENKNNKQPTVQKAQTKQPTQVNTQQETPKNNDKPKQNTETNTNTNTNQDKNTNTTNNAPKCSHSSKGWYNTKAEAIYNAEIKKWGDKWTNYEIDNDTYYKNCPSGYEVFSCPYCNKWTINLFY